MNTLAWIMILIAVLLIRLGWKGQVVDDEGNLVIFDNLTKLWTGIITGDQSAINEVLTGSPSGIANPTVDTSSSFDADGGYAGGGSGGGSGLSWSISGDGGGTYPQSWDSMNPKTVSEAVEYAASRKTFPSGMCERMVTLAYGHAGGFPTAKAHADAMTLYSGTPPKGALVFWATKNSAQHVGLSMGGGYVASTDFDGKVYKAGVLGIGPIANIDKWGPRRGWSAPKFK